MDDTTLWFFGIYAVGTAFGYAMGFKKGVVTASEHAIDALIAQGVIRTSKSENGELQIHKWDEK